MVRDVCQALWSTLQPEVMPIPTEETWIQSANAFATKWNFPHCIGAIDGKHMVIQAPPNSGSQYHNYHGSFSIIIMAVTDGNYKFILAGNFNANTIVMTALGQ